jgi:hypothetical protein
LPINKSLPPSTEASCVQNLLKGEKKKRKQEGREGNRGREGEINELAQ